MTAAQERASLRLVLAVARYAVYAHEGARPLAMQRLAQEIKRHDQAKGRPTTGFPEYSQAGT